MNRETVRCARCGTLNRVGAKPISRRYAYFCKRCGTKVSDWNSRGEPGEQAIHPPVAPDGGATTARETPILDFLASFFIGRKIAKIAFDQFGLIGGTVMLLWTYKKLNRYEIPQYLNFYKRV